ncbi:SusC/RagA family TonB-linked outer membrane protein [Dysgonomonas sp. ZJ279]|uniref:SusC/RagA family TonB-linked outer membrane protein n=1 Tax=Dysgonomonas sp. ZJ279 TaxID=2709796 RepID=UPI002106B6A5|nr:TonB-dependent receptor [Dysgonomonas sp. ZJ279]
MKLLTVLLILSVNVALASSSYAQQATLSLDIKNQRVADILDEIEKQSDFHFYYNSRLVDVERKVSIKANKKAVLPILSEIFADSDVDYKVLDKDVILTEKNKSTNGSQGVTQQQNTVSGVVRDQTGETILGVSVALKGTSVGTITDVDGAYSINVPNQDAILVFTFIGYLRQEEVVGSRKTLNISMKEDIKEMDEVVVIGYGTVKRANLAGAVSTTDSRTFQSRPVQNAANALQGEMPGLTVIRTSGAPGSSPTIRIRDMSSINGGSPLILIDGAEGDLNMINAADIDNISVLKDGTAAIYGARAADGVILVTTKNANKNQKLKVTLDAFYSVKKPALLKKAASLYQHAVMGLEITDGSFPIEYTQDELQLILDGSDKVLPTSNWGRWSGYPKFYKDQDWNDIMIGNGNLQNYNVSLSGGGEKYSYLISLGHQNEEGLLKFGTDNDKRYFVRTKSNIQIVKNLDYDLNLSYEASSRNYSSGISEGQNIWELIYKTRSWAPLYNPAGNFYTFEGFDNPAQVLEDGGLSNITTGNFTINNQLRWKVIDGLNLIGRAVVRKNDSDKYSAMKMLYSYNWDDVNHRTARKPNSAERSYSKTLYKNFTLYGEYKKTLGKHDLGVMVGAANESSDFDKFWAKRINFDQQESMPINLGSPEDQDASSEGNAWTINSFFSRVNYGFANKYIIEGTLRADGCSRFDPDSRWGYFPGASAVWRVGEESFMKDLKLFDDLKFRASYGEMGNQSGISFYDYIELINISRSYYPFGNGQRGQMAQQSNLVSSSRTWETIASKNLGIDFSVLDNRLYGSFDYFWKKNKNMLIPITYPSMLGISAPATNSGELKINGWEVTLGWRDQIGDFSYSVRANVSDARNEVSKRIGNSLIGLGMNRTPVGYPMDSYFGYVFDGIIQNEQQLNEYKSRFPKNDLVQSKIAVGDAMYKDLDGDGNLTVLGDGTEGAGDMVYLGNTNPRYNFGFNLNAEYKGFDFGAFIQGVGKRTMFLEGEASKPFAAPWYQSAEYWYGKTWTSERTDAKYPAITNDGKKDYNYYVSTNTKHNVAYVRLKNLQFGYTIPKKHLQKFKLEKIRVYFSGEDLFEIHNAPGGWDPEEGGGYVSYPFARNYSLGVNIVF